MKRKPYGRDAGLTLRMLLTSGLLGLLFDTRQGYWLLLALAAAFGAAHALTPGHGKTLVAAYLVGERGTVWHAVVLGLVTTMTHTGMVLILAVALRLFPDSARRDLQTTLGLASGLLIAGLGFWLLLRSATPSESRLATRSASTRGR